MKNAGFSLFALAAIAAMSLTAQQAIAQEGGQSAPPASPAAVPVPTTSAPAQQGNAATPAPSNSATAADFKPVKAELVSKLDSKSAKPGDPVVVKTREKVMTADGTEIPKGSKLMGHVTKVQAHSDTSQNSELALLFDQAQLKGGQTVAIHSTIQSVSPAEGAGQSANLMNGSPMTSPGGAPGGGGASPGGAMSGSRGGAPGSSTGSGPQPAASSTPVTTATADQSSPQGSGNGSGSGSAAGRVVAGSGPTAIRTTDIPNVFLASNAALQDSGVLFAAKDNVHLDGGTQMVLDIAPANAR